MTTTDTADHMPPPPQPPPDPVYLLLIDSRVANYQDIINSKQPGVYHVVFHVPETASSSKALFDAVHARIAELGVPSFTSIGLVQHNQAKPRYEMFGKVFGRMKPLVQDVQAKDPYLETWNHVTLFITMLRINYRIEYFDMMACALYSNPDWKYIIDELTRKTGVTVRASTDDTGAAALGGDWFLESHTGVNLKEFYFTDAIESFNGVLLTSSEPSNPAKKLILIDSRIKDIPDIINAANADTYCLVYNYFYDTPTTILSKLRFLTGENRYILDQFYYEPPVLPTRMDASGNHCTPCDDFDMDSIQLLPATLQTEYLSYTMDGGENNGRGLWPFYTQSSEITIQKPVFFQRSKVDEEETVVSSYESTDMSVVALNMNYKARPYVLVSDLDEIYELAQNAGEIAVGDSPAFDCVGIIQHAVPAEHGYKLVDNYGTMDGGSAPALVMNIQSADPNLSSWADFIGFIQSLKAVVHMSTLDLMACALYSNPDWRYIIDLLAVRENITIRASLDNTGTVLDEGNWILETNDIDLTDIYFTNKIYDWKYVLTTYIDNRLYALRWNDVMYATRNYDARLKIAAGTNNFTIETWYYETARQTNATIVDMGNYNYTFQVRNLNVANAVGLAFYNSGCGWLYAESAVVPVAQWSHLAITRSGSTITFYINGVARQTFTSSASFFSDNGTFAIGWQAPGTCNCNRLKLDSALYDLRLWSVARTATEIQMNRNRIMPANTTGLVANYLLTDNSGNLNDRTANGLHTTIQSYTAARWSNSTVPIPNVGFLIANGYSLRTSPTGGSLNAISTFDDITYTDFSGVDLSGVNFANANLTGSNFTNANLTNANLSYAMIVGATFTGAITTGSSISLAITSPTNVLQFDGADDAVNLGVPSWAYSPTVEVPFRRTMTVECWFKTTDTNNQKTYPSLVTRNSGGGVSSTSQFSLYMLPTGEIGFGLTNNTNVGSYHSTTAQYKDTQWHHAACSYDSASGIKNIYIDGILARTDTVPSGFGVLSNNSATRLIFGSDDGQFVISSTDRQFRGSLSDIRIWNVVRSATDISNNMRQRLIGNETGLVGYWKLHQGYGTGWATYTAVLDSTSNRLNGTFTNMAVPSSNWTLSTGGLSFQPRISTITLGIRSGTYSLTDNSFSFIDPSSNSLGDFTYTVSPATVATVANGASTRKTIYATSGGAVTIPTLTTFEFPELASLTDWQIDISFTQTLGTGSWRALIGDMYDEINTRGWGLWVSSSNRIHWSWTSSTAEPTTISVSLNTPYVLTAAQSSGTITLTLRTVSTGITQTGSFSVGSNIMGKGPVTIGGWRTYAAENFLGTISYVNVSVPTVQRVVTLLSVTGGTPATVTATQEGFLGFSANTKSENLTVSTIAPTILTWTIADVSFGVVTFTLTPPSTDSSGAFSYTSLNTDVATVSGNTVTVIRAGTATIRATQDACGNYLGGVVDASFTVSPIAPTISTWTIAGVSFGVAPFTLTQPSSDSSGAFAYTSLNTAVATVSGNTVTVVRAGTASIRATQSSNGNYSSGIVTASFLVSPIAPSIGQLTSIVKNVGDASVSLIIPNSNSNGTIAFSSSVPSVASIIGNSSIQVNALNFDGINDHIEYGLPAKMAGTTGEQFRTTCTLECWFRHPGAPQDTYPSIMARNYSGGTIDLSVFFIDTFNNNIRFYITTMSGASSVSSVNRYDDSQWHHIAATYNATIGQLILYIDGSIVGQTTNPSLGLLSNTTNSLTNFKVGGSRTDWDQMDFRGSIAEVRVWNVVRTPSQIYNNYSIQLTGYETGLIIYNKLNQGTANGTNNIQYVTNDVLTSGEGYSGTLVNFGTSGSVSNWVSGPSLKSAYAVQVNSVGETRIRATQDACGNYLGGVVDASFTVSPIAPTISTWTIAGVSFGVAPFALTRPSSDSSGAFAYTSLNTDVVTVSGNTVTVVRAGTATIRATQDACGNYTSRTVDASFAVSPIAPTISPWTIAGVNFGVAPFALTRPSSDSSGAFAYTSLNTAVATVSGNTVTVVRAGTATIRATQDACGNYLGGVVDASFTVSPIAPTISTWTIAGVSFGVAPFTLTRPSSDSSGAFAYTSLNTDVVTVSGNTVTVVRAGTATIRATQDACGNYTSRTVDASFAVSPIAPTISPWTIAGVSFGVAPFALTRPSSDSSGAFAYTSLNTAVATVSGNTVTVVRAGTATIRATQDACGNYLGGVVDASFTVSPIAPTISTWTIAGVSFGVAPFTLTRPSSDSSGAFAYTSLNTDVVTVSGNTVTVVRAGTATIRATQDACGNYLGGVVDASLVVNSTLSNFSVDSKRYGDAPFNLTNPNSVYSNEPFIFTIVGDTTVATIGGDGGRTVTILKAGETIIKATQAATQEHPELNITASFIVAKLTPAITLASITKTYGDASFNLVPSSTNTDISGGGGGGGFSFSSNDSSVASIFDTSYVSITGVGSATITITQSATTNFTDASNTVMLTVNKATPVLSALTVSSNRTYGSAPISALTRPTSISNGAITYSSSDDNVATIDNSGVITLVAAGFVVFTATQASTALYNQATKVSNTMTVHRQILLLGRSSPTDAVINKTYGDSYFTVSATNASNGGAITYETNNPSVAGVINASTGVISVVSVGTATITARRAQTAQYTSEPISWTVEVARATATLSGLTDLSYNVTAAPFTVYASSISNGPVTYSLQNPSSNVLTIDTSNGYGLVTLKAPGTAVIVASQAPGTLYQTPSSITATITVSSAGNVLQGATITNTTSFASVNLSGANLTNAVITSTNFAGADLSGAIFSGAMITGATFTSVSLASANLSGATLTSSVFTGADLSGARLTGVNASGSSFENARLNNANLTGANVENVNFTNTSIKGANITDVSFSPLQKLQLLKNSENRDIGQIIIPEVTGTTILAAISATSPLRAIPNLDLTSASVTVAVVVPQTSTSPTDILPDVSLNVQDNDKFYLPINAGEYFQIDGVKYYTSNSVVRNYATNAVVEVITYDGKSVWLLAGSIVGLVLQANTLSASSFVVPSTVLYTNTTPFMPTTLPTSNSDSPIVYSSSNTNIATIDPSSGLITPTGNRGSVRFTATQAQNATYAPGSKMSNIMVADRSVNFSLIGLNQTFNLSTLATLDASSINPDTTDATAVFYLRVSDMLNVFKYQTDAYDVNNADASDVKYYVFHRKWPAELKINPSHAMMNKQESSGMLGVGNGFASDKSLMKHDFIRYIALRLFNTIHGVDLFHNESDLRENMTYFGETVRYNIESILSGISTTSVSETMSYDASGNKYLTNDSSGNTNLCRELMRQVAAASPERFYNNGGDNAGLRDFPFVENDTILFKVIVQAAPTQNVLTGVSEIPSRSYTIKLVLKNTVTSSDNTAITDSEMYPNARPYSSLVTTYAATTDSSGVYNIYSPPAPIPFSRFGYNGWYYNNSNAWVNVSPTVRNHIKWLVAANTAGSSIVADLQYIRLNVKIYNNASLPYLMIYTQAGSSRKYAAIGGNGSLTNGTMYSMFINFNSYLDEPAMVGYTNAALVNTIGSGSFANNEIITSIAIETESNAAAGNVEFTLASMIVGERSTTTGQTSEKEYGFEADVPVAYP